MNHLHFWMLAALVYPYLFFGGESVATLYPKNLKNPAFEAAKTESKTDASSDFGVLAESELVEKSCHATDAPVLHYRAIVLIGSEAALLTKEKSENVQGVEAYDLFLPGPFSVLEERLTPLYLNQPMNRKTISAIKEAVILYYRDYGSPFVTVSVPVQNVTDGVLQLVVEESRLGSIAVEGNRWLSAKTIKQYMRSSPGEPISMKKFNQDMQFINRSPFRRVDAVFSAGEAANTTDLILTVEDQRPYRFYLGADNTGVPTIGRTRFFGGFSWDQMFGFDQILAYQYTTSESFKSFQAHTAQYTVYLPNETILNIYGGYSTLHTKLSYPNDSNLGKSAQGSVRYIYPLGVFSYFAHDLLVGADLKYTNNNVTFVDTFPVFSKYVNLFQFFLGYEMSYSTDSMNAQLKLEAFASPGPWLPHQSNSDYGTLRPGSKNHWAYFRAITHYDLSLPQKFSLHFSGELQWSPTPLLPSEQIGIGGYNTVRGYDERQLNGDAGFILSGELHAPRFAVFSRKTPSLKDSLDCLIFLEGGFAHDVMAIAMQQTNDFILSTGLGARYQLSTYLKARLDWGIKLHQQALFTGGWSMLQFNVTSYF